MDKIDLTDKSYAMIFSANIWHKADQEAGRNVLLLVDDKGKWDAYTTYLLDRANVNWTKDGLYLSDYKYEYFINNEGTIQKAERTTELLDATAQDGSSVDEENGVWSWFDVGFSDDGYDTRLTYQNKDKRTEKIVEGVYSHLFTAGTELYGVTSSFDLPNGINKGGQFGLVKFVGEELTPTVLSSYPLPTPEMDVALVSQQVAQKGDTIHVIGEAESEGETIQTNLMKWNLNDGEFELDRIAVPTDHFSGEISVYSYYTDQDALIGNDLYWFNERAELMKTSIDTNQTDLIQSYDVDIQDEMFYTARFVGDQIHMMVNDTTWGNSSDSAGTKMRLIKTSVKSPETYTTVEISKGDKLSQLFSSASLTPTQNSFAVRPIHVD
ncbi:hypothetical protein [Sporosarcina sp.]|uniref:hypothetical protein n=1 Tax=Sporosarcina sp. TaxID=49982 RepID=UPI002601D9A9|nr:hypothetical protein [Sporosarcina sp.]